MKVNKFMARYSVWAGSRTSWSRRMRVFISYGLKFTLRSKWSLLALLLTYGLILFPRVFMVLLPGQGFSPQFYLSLYEQMQLFIILFAAVIGSGIMANDWKDKSIVLYFTKGFSRIGYVIGKFTILVLSFSLITILPMLILYAIAIISSDITTELIRDKLWILGAGLGMGIALTLFLTLLTAGLSTLLNDRRYTGASLFAVFLISKLVSQILFSLNGNEKMQLVSVWDNFTILGSYLFRTGNPYGFPQYYSFLVIVGISLAMLSAVYLIIFKRELKT